MKIFTAKYLFTNLNFDQLELLFKLVFLLEIGDNASSKETYIFEIERSCLWEKKDLHWITIKFVLSLHAEVISNSIGSYLIWF